MQKMYYNVFDWYWQIGDDKNNVFGSAKAKLVPTTDNDYQAWLETYGVPSKIPTKDELKTVFQNQLPSVISQAGTFFP